MSMRIDDICTYAPKSGIKAGEAVKDGQYVFFTSSEDESKRYADYLYDGEGIIMGKSSPELCVKSNLQV